MNDQSPTLTQLSVPLARQGRNIAPAKPIYDAIQSKKIDPKRYTQFEKSIQKWITEKLNYGKQTWEEIISVNQLVSLFRSGNQLLQRRRYGPGWYVRPIQDDTTYRQTAMSFMGFHSQVCEAKIMASNPSVNMRAGDDTPEAIAAAQACRPVVDCYETEWYTAKFSRREGIRLLTDGIFIHEVKWNPFKGGYHSAERTVSQREVVIDPGGGECLDCRYEGEIDSFNQIDYGHQCPECGSSATEVRQPIKSQLAQIGMGQSRPIGEPELVSSPFAAWRWDLSKDLECSSWAIKRQRVSQGAIKLMLGDIVIPDSMSSDSYGLDVIHALAYSGQAFQGSSPSSMYGPREDTRPTLAECWMSPEDQAEIEFDEYETVDGRRIPRGRLSNLCQGEPCCVVTFNDGALTVGVFPRETHQDSVVTAHWFMEAESGSGRGMVDTTSVQRRYNAVDGQIYQGLATTATPAVITDMSILKEDQGRYLFRPGENIDVSLAMLPPNTTLKDAFFIGNPGQVNPQYIQYGYVYLQQMAQISSLITEMSLGNSGSLIGVDNRTATGAQITAALANSLYGPMLMSKGQSRVEIAKKIVCLVAKHDVGGRYYPGKGAARGRMVSGEDLKHRVIFALVQNSELPVTPFSQQTDVRVLVESFGGVQGLVGLKTADRGMFRQLTKPFGVKLDDEDMDDVSNLCLQRLEQMKANLMAGVNDPQILVSSIRPTIRQTEPKHKEKADWWSNWLDLQSAQESPEELRQAAENMYYLHMNLDTQRQIPQAMNQGLVQSAAMAPAALGQAALQPAPEQQQVEDDSAEIESKEKIEGEKRDTELQTKQMEVEGQLATAQIQRETQIEMTKLQGDNAVRAAKARPKPTVRKSA